MRPRTLVSITLLLLCHLSVYGQALTHALPPAPTAGQSASEATANEGSLPNDPSEELIPVAEPEPVPPGGLPVVWQADRQNWVGDTLTLTGHVTFSYRDYILRADKVVYHRTSTEIEADGHLEMTGGPARIYLSASHGDLRLNMHTARFYNVSGIQNVPMNSNRSVYSTNNPFRFTARVLLQTGEGKYRLIDGTMTNCEIPRPDWRILSRTIKMEDETASTRNSFFQLFGVPIFYLPYLRHPVDITGRESGLLIPVISNSSLKGFVAGAQVYLALNRSMDMVIGSEYYSKRGWAPNGDFRYRGNGLDHLLVRWNGLFDRGVDEKLSSGGTQHVNQGGVELIAEGRKDFDSSTHASGVIDYLSSYVYRLTFNDNYSQAVSSQVSSRIGITHARNGFVPSVFFDRYETFASSTKGDEVRILHLPMLRYDVVDQPLGSSPLYWGLGSSLSYLNRSALRFHARNVGRFDLYPRLSLPLEAGGWNIVPTVALRATAYSISQTPDLDDTNNGMPTISHNPLNRVSAEADLALRPPVLTRDFALPGVNRILRHVIEPELNYRIVRGIGDQAQRVLLVDTTDIATNTNEIGYSLTQHFYLRPQDRGKCSETEQNSGTCPHQPREWATWQIAQKYFFDHDFGGALIPQRRNVFDTTLDLSGVAFLTAPERRSPVISRLRFEAIDDLRIEWDLDYDPRAGQFSSDNFFAGYSIGLTTFGLGHALLNAVDENRGSASTIKSQQLQPFLTIGKANRAGFNLAASTSYDYVLSQVQHIGVQANYNWDCCGLSLGYRRFQLGPLRDETQYLYSFTIANFGSVGDIRHSNSAFRDPDLPPAY